MKKTRFQRFLAFVLVVCMVIPLLPAFELPVLAAESNETPVIVIAGGDFQNTNTDHAAGAVVVQGFLNQIKEDYPTADGFLSVGDYTYNYEYADGKAGKEAFQGAISSAYPEMSVDSMIWVQGNHDPDQLVTDGVLSSSGAHDADAYGVYVINEQDYMWYNDDEARIRSTASALDSYLDAKYSASYSKPIFVVSHLPLHYSMRTMKGGGDGKYANYIFDVLNEAGAKGLNIIFMYGHNHSHGWDDYIGGAAVYLAKGDSINIAQGSNVNYKVETLNFTYMNPGFVSYYGDTGNNFDKTLTMTAFEISDDRVIVKRYDANGQHVLKAAGVYGGEYPDNDNAVPVYPVDPTVYESGQVIKLNQFLKDSGGSGISIAGPGATGVWADADYVGNASSYDDFYTYDIHVTGHAEGDPLHINIPTNYWYDAKRPVTVIDHKDNTALIASVIDGSVVFETDHSGRYSILQAEADVGMTAWGSVDYLEHVTSLKTGVPYVITSFNYGWVMTGTQGTSASQGKGMILEGKPNVDTSHLWYYDGQHLLYQNDTSKYLQMDYMGDGRGDAWVGVINSGYEYRLINHVFFNNSAASNNTYIAGTFSLEAAYGYNKDKGYFVNRRGGMASDIIATTWTASGNSTADSAWYFYEKVSDEIRFNIASLADVIYVGGGTVLMPTIHVDNEAAFDYEITWTSSNNAVAAVNNGYVHPLKAGAVTITAQLTAVNGRQLANPVSISYPITVKSAVASASNGASVTESTDAWTQRVSYLEPNMPYVVTVKTKGWVLSNEVGTNGQGSGFMLKNEAIASSSHTWSYDGTYLKYGNPWGTDNFLLLSGDNSGFAPATLGNEGDHRQAIVYLNTKDHESFTIWNNSYSVALNRLYGGDATIATTWGQDGNITDDSAWYFNKVVSAWNATMTFDSYDDTLYIDDVMTFKPTVTQNGTATNKYKIIWKSSDESVATVNDGEVTPFTAGNVSIYATLVAVNGTGVEEQITVQLPLTIVGMESFSISAAQASVTQFSGSRAATGAYLTVKYTDGSTKNIPVTVGMLSTADGKSIDTSVAGTYSNLVVSYCGISAYHGFTLYVAPRVFDDYPDYPDEGAVIINKTGTGVDFQYSGIGKIELSATGIPVKKGADVIVMLDTSSSMNIGMTGSSQTRLQVLTQSMNNLLNSLQADGEDGEPLDIRIAIADFNGYFTNSDSPYYNDPADTTDGNFIRTSVGNAEVYTGSKKLDADAFVDVHELGEDPFYTAGYTGASNEKYTLTYSSGTNYDYAFDAVYQLGESVKSEERDLFVIFMSDGAPFQYNYFSSQSGLNGVGEHAEYWNNWLTGTMEDSMYGAGANKAYYNDKGLHWMAEAIKGDPETKYPVIRKNNPNADANNFVEVLGLGATMYSIGFCLQQDGKIELETMNTVIGNIASAPEYYFRADTADELSDAFSVITGEINYAATDAYFVDVMGDDYDLQLKTDTYIVKDGSNRTLTPVIQVKAYSIYTKEDVENGLCTENQIGQRKTDANGDYIYILLEEVTFNADGTEAYTNVKRSSTNILIDGIICADTFFYNTTDKTVTIDLGEGKSYNLTPETFYWKVGTISTTELTLSYYVYLTGSQEGNRAAGIYDTNESATLYYTNYRGTPAEQSVATPKFPWQQASVGYGFYIVNAYGEPIVNLSTGETGSFDRAVKITDPTYIDFLINGAEQQVNASDVYTAGNIKDLGYYLYDTGAEYNVSVKDDGSGHYTVVSTDSSGKKTTYVVGVESTPVNNTGTTNTSDYVTANTVVWFAVVILIDANPDEIVIDYGIPVDVHPLVNDEKMDTGYSNLAAIGPVRENMPEVDYTEELATGFGNQYVGKYGVAEIINNGTNDTANATIRYTLNTSNGMQMAGVETFTYAAQYTGYYGKQGYYYATITIIPAANMYFEDSYLTFTDSTVSGDLGQWTTDRSSITVSCYNERGWTEVYAYCPEDNGTAGSWPGVRMEDNDGDGIFTATVSADQIGKTVVFNNSGNQTSDLKIYADSPVYSQNGSWIYKDYDQSTSTTGNIYVYFNNSDNWDEVYVYCWGEDGNTGWPGKKMGTNTSYYTNYGWLIYQVPEGMSNIIFHNNAGIQTADLGVKPGFVYRPDNSHKKASLGDKEASTSGDRYIYFNPDNSPWTQVYAYCWNDSGQMSAWPGTAMTYDTVSGLYRLAVPRTMSNVVFNNGGSGTVQTLGDVKIQDNGMVYRQPRWEYSSDGIDVYFDNASTNWSNVYAYYWNYGDTTLTSWPGVKMTKGEDGLYHIKVPANAEYIIFNSGSSLNQTGNITVGTSGTTYYPDGSTVNNSTEDKTYYYVGNIWDKVYAHYWGSDGGTKWPGVEMTYDSTTCMYSVTVPYNMHNIIFNNGSGSQTGDLLLPGSGSIYHGDAWTDYKGDPSIQAEDRPGSAVDALAHIDADNVYGYDSAYGSTKYYSLGTAPKVTVDAITGYRNNAPMATFWFTGTGFDVVSITDNRSGAVMVEVYPVNNDGTLGNRVRSTIVTNYYGYTFENGEWIVKKDASDCLYQVPVVKESGLPYGKYKVVIRAAYLEMLDAQKKGSYTIWLDAIRTYNPAVNDETANDAYVSDNEANPSFVMIRDILVDQNSFSSDSGITGAAFIDGFIVGGNSVPNLIQYANQGPNNEAYLTNGQAIAFELVTNSNVKPTCVHIGAKLAAGDEVVLKLNGVTLQQINTATNMFYDLDLEWTQNSNGTWTTGTIVLSCEAADGNILSLTDMKVTSTNGAVLVASANADVDDLANEAAPVVFAMVRTRTLANVKAMVNGGEVSCEHNWIAGNCTTPKTCELCGAVEGDVVHNYNSYHVCKKCMALRPGQIAGIYGFNVSLGGNIAVNYYMVLDDSVAADPNAKMVFSVPESGGFIHAEVPVSEARKVGNFYVFTCEVAAKEITSEIFAQIVTADAESDRFGYTVMTYATSVLANPDKYPDEVPLVKALLNYSAAAQVYFNHNTGSLANNSQYITENDKILSNVDLSQFAYTESGSQTGVQFYGANLSLESETAIKLYFVIEGDASALEMTVNGQAVTAVKNGNYYEIKISDIPAHKLGQMYEIKVGGLTLNYGAFSYGFKAMNTTNENLKNTVKALYAYYQAAVAYQN